jgi:hypothetical protein
MSSALAGTSMEAAVTNSRAHMSHDSMRRCASHSSPRGTSARMPHRASSRAPSLTSISPPTTGDQPRDQLTSRHGNQYGHSHDFVFEKEKLSPLASVQTQGRRRAARVQQLAILHKVGCSWFARPTPLLVVGSAGPTTPPRFEPTTRRGVGRQTGEPTVSHEGCSGAELFLLDLSFIQGTFPSPLPRHIRGIHPTARRVARRPDPSSVIQGERSASGVSSIGGAQ